LGECINSIWVRWLSIEEMEISLGHAPQVDKELAASDTKGLEACLIKCVTCIVRYSGLHATETVPKPWLFWCGKRGKGEGGRKEGREQSGEWKGTGFFLSSQGIDA